MPSSVRMRSTSTGGTVAAPVVPPRKDEQSKSWRSFSASSIWNIVGGPGRKLIRSRSIAAITARTSNCGIGTMTAPAIRQATQPTFIPKLWKNGFTIR